MNNSISFRFWFVWSLVLMMVACSPGQKPDERQDHEHATGPKVTELVFPQLNNVAVGQRPIRIVATTGIIGDVASTIAGEDAEVEALMAPNQDPHGYQNTARDLRLVANADAVLVNGWRLEEGLIDDLKNAAGDVPIVPVSAGIKPHSFDQSEAGDETDRIDPHVWLSPANVIVWADNIELLLSTLDPTNSASYALRAEEFRSRLRDLDKEIRRQLEPIDDRHRVLVTNHDAFGYFADAYDFTILGTIIPGDSSLAEPTSGQLVALIERMREAGVCAVFVERSANQRIAAQLAADLDHCDGVEIVALYSGALGDPGSGAETYLTMMEANVDMIVGGLVQRNEARNGN